MSGGTCPGERGGECPTIIQKAGLELEEEADRVAVMLTKTEHARRRTKPTRTRTKTRINITAEQVFIIIFFILSCISDRETSKLNRYC